MKTLKSQVKVAGIAFFFSGFTTMAYEVLWTRVLILTLGTTTYAFTLILVTFILGIALGSFAVYRVVDSIKNLYFSFAFVEIAIGISVLLLTPALGNLPYLFLKGIAIFHIDLRSIIFLEFILSVLIMILPTILIGTTFPFVSKWYSKSVTGLGASIGKIYMINTVGSVAGSIAGGFVFIPFLGLQRGILVCSWLNLLMGGLLVAYEPELKERAKYLTYATLAAISFFSALWIPNWDRNLLSSGIFYKIKSTFRDREHFNEQLRKFSVVYYKEGIDSTNAVIKNEKGELIYLTNGKPEASTNHGDMRNQYLLGHIPLLLHRNPKSGLVVALGAGTTLGAAGQHNLERLDCVEISNAVPGAARMFSSVNHDVMNNPKAKIIIDDARDYLLTTQKKYDVITSDPVHPWLKGGAALYSRDYYLSCKDRLNDGGVVAQWLPLYELSRNDLKIIIKTFHSVFPHTSIWMAYTDAILIGTSERLSLDFNALENRFNHPGMGQSLF